MAVDPIGQLVRELAESDRPSAAWLETWSGDGDPVTLAWLASAAPHTMIRFLAIAQHEDIDAAARAAIAGAAETLRAEDPRSHQVDELLARSNSATACAELAHLLFGVWCVALPDGKRREMLESQIAARVRAAVNRPPTLVDIAPPPPRDRPTLTRGASHLAATIADTAGLRVLDADAIRQFARGEVMSPESFGRSGPELGGLACERIFGTWRPRTPAAIEDDRDVHWGFIALAHPCAHPVLPDARLTLLPVVPPHYRRSTVVPVEELRRHAHARREELERRDDLSDPVDKILAEEGLSDPDTISEPGRREHQLSTVYRAFINLGRRQQRLVELGAPAAIVAQQGAELDEWSRVLGVAWQEWVGELPEDTEASWALRALAVFRAPS